VIASATIQHSADADAGLRFATNAIKLTEPTRRLL
jgi:hypothetical protein